MVTVNYSRGGPGLPAMGTFLTNWFTEKHEFYSDGKAPILAYDPRLEMGSNDPFCVFDYFPIPLIWHHSLFQSDLWNIPVRKFGTKATRMGPLSMGTRFLAGNPADEPAIYIKSSELATVPVIAIPGDMNQLQMASLMFENGRRAKAFAITLAVSRLVQPEAEAAPPEEGAHDEEDEHTTPKVYNCPRWDEITQYLFKNRGPEELALDTMKFEMPEPNLYRYILDRGGLDISIAEFRQFLGFANQTNQIFQYITHPISSSKPNALTNVISWFPFPGTGVIALNPNGWPPAKEYTIEPKAPPQDIHWINFELTIRDTRIQNRIYWEFGEYRDIAYSTLAILISRALAPDQPDISEAEMELLVNKSAMGMSGMMT